MILSDKVTLFFHNFAPCMEERVNILQEIRDRVAAIEPSAKVILYGSRARRDAREDSDWDFLVILEYESSTQEKEILQAVYEYELLAEMPISVFVTSKDMVQKYRLSPFYQSVMRDGIDISSASSLVEEPVDDSSFTLDELVVLRLQKSDQAFNEARFSFAHESFSLALNRLYYAAFYSVTALLMRDGVFVKTHQGVKNLFHKHVVLSGMVSRESGSLYNELFDKRMKGDYSLIYEPGRSEVEEYFPRVKDFISDVRKLIEVK